MHGTVGFFETGAVTAPDIGTSWTFQNGGAITKTKSRVGELGDEGDEILKALYDVKETTSFTYLFKQPATPVAAYAFPKIGDIKSTWHIDSFTVVWNRDSQAAKLTLNCHRHTGVTGGHETGRTYTPSLSAIVPATFGCPSAFIGAGTNKAFELTSGAVVAMRSATYTFALNHIDELNGTGGHLAGNNYDANETLNVELTGSVTEDDYETSWDETNTGNTPSNTGVTTSSMTFENHVAHDVAASS